jgi:hypothetical protein
VAVPLTCFQVCFEVEFGNDLYCFDRTTAVMGAAGSASTPPKASWHRLATLPERVRSPRCVSA